jgi:hypothetical protein
MQIGTRTSIAGEPRPALQPQQLYNHVRHKQLISRTFSANSTFRQQTVFFSHNKSVNNTFRHSFSAEREWFLRMVTCTATRWLQNKVRLLQLNGEVQTTPQRRPSCFTYASLEPDQTTTCREAGRGAIIINSQVYPTVNSAAITNVSSVHMLRQWQ